MPKTILFTLIICALVLTGCTEQLSQGINQAEDLKETAKERAEAIVIDSEQGMVVSGGGAIVESQEEWKTYRDEQTAGFGLSGYEFKYPAAWEVFVETLEAGSSVVLRYKVSKLAGDRYPAFYVKSMSNQGGLTLEQWWEEAKDRRIYSYSVREKVGTTKVAGIEAYEFKSGEMGAGSSYVFIYGSEARSGWIFDIATGSEAQKETIDRIVESFKLIES